MSFIEGIKLYEGIKDKWRIDNGWLIYRKKITCKGIKYEDRIYKYEDSTFFIKGLKIRIVERVYNSNVSFSEGYHANCTVEDGEKKICIGDLEGRPLKEVLEKIVQTMEICNLDSAYENEATTDLREIVEEIHGGGGEVWTTTT